MIDTIIFYDLFSISFSTSGVDCNSANLAAVHLGLAVNRPFVNNPLSVRVLGDLRQDQRVLVNGQPRKGMSPQ